MTVQSVEQIKQEMIKEFGDTITAAPHYDDYALIGSSLTNPQIYGAALRELEEELEASLMKRLAAQFPSKDLGKMNKNDKEFLQKSHMDQKTRSPDFQWSEADDKTAAEQLKKLLTEVLTKREAEYGFKASQTNETAKIIVGLPKAFNLLLRNGHPFKDIGAGKEHGESSHRIQWYVVTHLKTKNPTIAIYKNLPDYTTPPREPRKFYMWEFLVDRDGVPTNADVIPFKTADKTDFRAPSNLNRWLVSEEGRNAYPWLHACLKYKWDKRDRMNPAEYVAKKMFGKKNPKDITNEEYDQALTVVMKGILTR